MSVSSTLGQKGEDAAAAFLKENGYAILARNFRFNKAEVDILASKANVIIAVEVKTRSNTYFGKPETFISPAQNKRIIMATDAFLNQENIEKEVRFDVIALTPNGTTFNINHIKAAFNAF